VPRALCLQHVPFEGPARLAPLLRERGFEVVVVPVFEGGDLPTLGAGDVVVVTGGPMSVNDVEDHPWLDDEIQWIGAALDTGQPVLGICLGSQLIARALGAGVAPNAEREIGWFGVEPVGDEPLARALTAPPRVLHWHGDRWELPRGARLLVRSEGCDHQAFAVGAAVLGIQYHLEMDHAAVAALVENCPDDLAPGRWVQSAPEILDADLESSHAALEVVVEEWSRSWSC